MELYPAAGNRTSERAFGSNALTQPVAVEWTNPSGVDTTRAKGFLYFISIVEPTTGQELRYIGKSTTGASRLRAYRCNVERIFKGLPRRTTPKQERYRAVHLALAKACLHGWKYEFRPLENVALDGLNRREHEQIALLNCNLNVRRSWEVKDFHQLQVLEFLAEGRSAGSAHAAAPEGETSR